MSQSHWVFLPAGGVGLAFGLEARRETHQDTRAAAVDGSTPFTDPVTGQISASSATGVNSTPSTSGSRDIYSSFIELAVPLVSPAMGIPLIQSLDMQLAGRYEYYDEFGSVAKPKVAMNWGVFGGLKLRASFQQGFKAPNLETVDPFTYVRAQSVQDYYRCEADLRTHKISTFSACTRSVTIAYNESGNPSLKPETSSSYSFGFVLEPTFLPDSAGRLTLSVDRWQLKQTAVVGVIGVQNLSAQDYLSRLQGGAGSARVVRAAPTPDDIAAFAGSGLAPVGAIMQMNDQFQNLLPQTLSGVDGAVAWQSLAGRVGTIAVNLNASLLDKFYQAPSLAEQSLLLARAGGLINPATPLAITGDQLEKLDNPRIKASASLTWSLKGAQAGASLVYTGKTQDTALLSNTGVPWPVASLTVINLYGQFTFGHLPGIHDLRLRLGVRNLFNRMPPLESEGYNPALYVPYGRYLYGNVGVEF